MKKTTSNLPKSKSNRKTRIQKKKSIGWTWTWAIPSILTGILVAWFLQRWYVGNNSNGRDPEPPFEVQLNSGQFHPSCEVRNISGRGKGVMAKRFIPKGTQLVREHPLFRLPATYDLEVDPNSTNNFIKSILEQGEVSSETRNDFYDLANPWKKERPLNWSMPEVDIYRSNAIATLGGEGGVFANISRINHSCRPKVAFHWRSQTEEMTVQAVHDIHPGEEVMTSYFNILGSRKERQQLLWERYKFKCQCPVCSIPVEDSAASDRRRGRIIILRSELFQLQSGSDLISARYALSELVPSIISLMDEESYYPDRGQIYAFATWIAALHSDEEGVMAWGAKTAEIYEVETGKDSEASEAMRMIAKEPKLHVVWGRRDPLEEKLPLPV